MLSALALLLSGAAPAVPASSAHTRVVATSPRAGASLADAPRVVTITFSAQLLRGTVTVRSAAGRRVSVGPGRRDPQNIRRLRVGLEPALAAGRYTVRWASVGPDGHSQSGSFWFRVRR